MSKSIDEKVVTASLAGSYRIHFKKNNALKGFSILLYALGQVGCLSNDTYLVSDHHILLLEKAGVHFEIVK